MSINWHHSIQRRNFQDKSTTLKISFSKKSKTIHKLSFSSISRVCYWGNILEKLLSSSQGPERTDILEKETEPYLGLVLQSRVELP